MKKPKINCDKCNKEISRSNFERHYKRCSGIKNKKAIKIDESWKQQNGMYKCPICGKEYTRMGISTHIWRMHKDGINHKPGFAKTHVPWNKNLKNDPRCQFSEERRRKIGIKSLNRKHTEETKQKMSKSKKDLYATGWESIAGRCKKFEYISNIAGNIKVDGTWELLVAKYLDILNVQWNRNKNRFFYIKPDNKESHYTPDFFVKDWDTYIEVKGYETELDRCKWNQFPHKIEIWKKEKIIEIQNILNGGLVE